MKVLKRYDGYYWRNKNTGRKVQNAMNKRRGLKTSVETNTTSTNNIFNVIFQFFNAQNYLLEAVQKDDNEYILRMPAVALQIDRLFYAKQNLGFIRNLCTWFWNRWLNGIPLLGAARSNILSQLTITNSLHKQELNLQSRTSGCRGNNPTLWSHPTVFS